MKTAVKWNEGLSFQASAGNNLLPIDAKPPMGRDSGATPKELVAMAIAGCSAMDVISLLKKYKQLPSSFSVEADVEQTDPSEQPVVFKTVSLNFVIEGNVESDRAVEAVTLSMTKYCGVAAMIAKGCPIDYTITLNQKNVYAGRAVFNTL